MGDLTTRLAGARRLLLRGAGATYYGYTCYAAPTMATTTMAIPTMATPTMAVPTVAVPTVAVRTGAIEVAQKLHGLVDAFADLRESAAWLAADGLEVNLHELKP